MIRVLLLLALALSSASAASWVFVGNNDPYTTNYYVDSVGGSDSNSGTIASPFQTLTHVEGLTLPAWTAIHLKRGSTWTGSAAHLVLDVANVEVIDYGSGGDPLPKIDGRVVMTAGSWTNHSGACYKYDFTALISTAEQANIWQDGVRLARVADIATCISTAGSYYVPPEGGSWVAGFPTTFYMHATDGSNPASSGKVYTTQGVIWAIFLGSESNENAKLYNVEAMGGCHHNGNVELGRNSYANGVTVRWGTIHSLYTDSGFFINCTSYDCEQGFDFVANKGSSADGFIEMNGCVADLDATTDHIQGPAFFVHGTTEHTIRYIDCISHAHINGFGVNGIGEDGQTIFIHGCSVYAPSDANQLKSYDINTLDNGGTFTSAVTLDRCLSDGYGFFLWGYNLNAETSVSISGARGVIRGTGNPAIQFRNGAGVEVAYSSFYAPDAGYSCIEMTIDGTACNFHNNIVDNFSGAGATEQFNATVWTADNNVYYHSTGWRIAGTYYPTFLLYQAGASPQDANAVVGDPLWTAGNPATADDFTIDIGSPATALTAGYTFAP